MPFTLWIKMDDIDRLVERDEKEMEALIAFRKPVIRATGSCLNCDEPLLPGVCYCDADCREDHEKELKLRNEHPRLR